MTRQQQQAKRVPDGHGLSYGSWPWQKYFLLLKKNTFLKILFFLLKNNNQKFYSFFSTFVRCGIGATIRIG